ncbi:teichoic acid polysaccharide glycosyl transferase, group 1 [Agrilactobacillus composti DSM 18527 = JCM 14202]|uniref:Teichoic acid polysaccharide glycosyl transferase, group 1 n=1 Tax=Agrilactobacillus composti DSM 18527 = JCM 14202 TaxID=1423734 RepID=X0PUI7_9LACO|nr:glycosyltransferase [Agrilactobacillus composti]KRM34968.1 teichoic acid polysaccharide glycosyl transferase, group 1 [Agrilactobacillus composti DSM 18527 = JCM 14202]GAF41041.1 poly(glycerol-phosphate) alpha-glucosyltransferase [Agrilactobacillus composti DSM 18527 = JCM 14202]
MKILIVNAGNETGGGRAHMVWLIGALNKIPGIEAELLVFEDSAVAKMAREYQVKTTVIAQNSQLDLSVLKRYRNFVNDNHFDIVHTHGPRANVLTRFIQHKINATWVVTVHSEPHVDFPKGGLKGKAFLKLNINALKKAKHLYLITDYFRDELHSYGIPDGDMTPIFNAINFHDTPIDRPEHEPFNILNVARVTYVKNQALLLKALAQVDFDYKVTILGDGPLEDDLKALAKTLQIQDKVDVAGFTENTQPYYDQADLFVLPSTSEGFPTVLLEAADAELPAIATKVGSDDVVIPNADLGWIFPSDDQAALVKALAEAHGEFEAGTLVNRGKAFKNFAASHFSADNLAKTMVDLYQQAQK